MTVSLSKLSFNKTPQDADPVGVGKVVITYGLGLLMQVLTFVIGALAVVFANTLATMIADVSLIEFAGASPSIAVLITGLAVFASTGLVCDLLPERHPTTYGWPVLVLIEAICLGQVMPSNDVPWIAFEVGVCLATLLWCNRK